MHVVEYDGKSLLDYNQNKTMGNSQPQLPMGSHDYSNSLDHEISIPSLPVPVPAGQPTMDSGVTVGGYHDAPATRFSMQPQNANLDSSIQFDGTALPLQNQVISSSHQTQLPRNEDGPNLGPSQSATPSFQNVSMPNPAYRGLEDFFPEDEIRIRSHEMLENEDMQHLLRIFNMGGHANTSFNTPEYGYPCSSAYLPTSPMSYNFDDERNRSSGKAVVGWLKLKAALRWGIFIRKKAAERRAQLIELDDS
ncbi:calmodulin-binding protein 60 C [Senna tora]|uniref:Calmodulin-binding protein 60 C n=1 Tax=Senna tora TaxID=362788 RepID=A0A834VZN6_9FABA|nr:calmodulin-binding protein 60 C [Senna tora]